LEGENEVKFRQHRGSLTDSMTTVVEIEPTIEAITAEIEKNLQPCSKAITVDRVHVQPLVFDKRIGWNTHTVWLDGFGVCGYTDGPVVGANG
jgi:hypothetical protein